MYLRYILSLGALESPRTTHTTHTHTSFVSSATTSTCIILQLVNSCPHPVSATSCVPLSPSPFFLLFSLLSSFLPPSSSSLTSRRRSTARCHTGYPERVGPRWWTGAFSTCRSCGTRPPLSPSSSSSSPVKFKRRELLYCLRVCKSAKGSDGLCVHILR